MSSLSTTDRLQDLLPQLFNQQQRQGSYYLRFQLTPEILGLIDLKYVRESLTVEGDRLTAVPNLPEYTVGLMSSRNQVFLAVDLAHLIGFAPQTVNLRRYQTIVVQISQPDAAGNSVNFGLTVKSIQGISRLTAEQFNSNAELAPDILSPYVLSSVMPERQENDAQSDLKKISFLLDIPRLIQTKI